MLLAFILLGLIRIVKYNCRQRRRREKLMETYPNMIRSSRRILETLPVHFWCWFAFGAVAARRKSLHWLKSICFQIKFFSVSFLRASLLQLINYSWIYFYSTTITTLFICTAVAAPRNPPSDHSHFKKSSLSRTKSFLHFFSFPFQYRLLLSIRFF